jgi:hypothetical protein
MMISILLIINSSIYFIEHLFHFHTLPTRKDIHSHNKNDHTIVIASSLPIAAGGLEAWINPLITCY